MADQKISALPASTTPLAGTEVLPIVQSSTTKQVSVSNLTAGRAVSALSLNVNTTYAGAPVQIASAPGGSDLSVAGINVMGTAEVTTGQIMNGVSFTALNNTNRARAAVGCIVGTNWGYGNLVFYTRGAADGSLLTSADEKMRIDSTGIVTMSAYGAGAATFSASGVISSVSDENWKRKDGVPTNPTEMLKKLEPGYWYYNDKYKDTFGVDRQLGFYAQNVNAAIGPEAAPEPESYMAPNEEGVETLQQKPWGYYDRSVLAVVVMALKDALETIESLKIRLTALENK